MFFTPASTLMRLVIEVEVSMYCEGQSTCSSHQLYFDETSHRSRGVNVL